MNIHHIIDPLITFLSPVSLIKFSSTSKYFYNKYKDLSIESMNQLLNRNKFFKGTNMKAIITNKRATTISLNHVLYPITSNTAQIEQYYYSQIIHVDLTNYCSVRFPQQLGYFIYFLDSRDRIPFTEADEIIISMASNNNNIKNCFKYAFGDNMIIVMTGPLVYKFDD